MYYWNGAVFIRQDLPTHSWTPSGGTTVVAHPVPQVTDNITLTPFGDNSVVPQRRYTIDFSAVLPPDTGLAPGDNVQSFVVAESAVLPSGCTLTRDGQQFATFSNSPNATLSVGAGQKEAVAAAPARFASFVFPSSFQAAKPGSINGILNHEQGTSQPITNTQAQQFTVGTTPSHQDECAYLHMDPSPLSTLSCMGNPGVRDIVSRIPLSAKYPDQNHHFTFGLEYDYLNFSRRSLRRLKFSLRFADGTLLPPRGHTSFSILFAVIE